MPKFVLQFQESRDPRRLGPMLEILMDNPLRGSGGSFGDSRYLNVLVSVENK